MIFVSGRTVVTVNANRDVIEHSAVLIDGDRIVTVGRAIDMEQEIGSLGPGKKADLVVMAFDNS